MRPVLAAPPRRAVRLLGWSAVALAVCVVAVQIPYPLLAGSARDAAIVAGVVVFALASLTHAAAARGTAFAATLAAVAGGGGLAVEVLGTATGWPFGPYSYTGDLGPRVADVPLVIPLAWTMMAYPALVIARRTASRWVVGVPLAAWALTAWDLYLDPQMLAAGQWTWAVDGVYLGVPLLNYAGWMATALVMMTLLWPAAARAEATKPTRRAPGGDAVPLALYVWTWLGSAVAHVAFLELPVSGVVGGAGMGGVVLAWWARRRSARPVAA